MCIHYNWKMYSSYINKDIKVQKQTYMLLLILRLRPTHVVKFCLKKLH